MGKSNWCSKPPSRQDPQVNLSMVHHCSSFCHRSMHRYNTSKHMGRGFQQTLKPSTPEKYQESCHGFQLWIFMDTLWWTNIPTWSTWWFIPLSKWVITAVISGLTPLTPFITRVVTHLLSGMSHQVWRTPQKHPFIARTFHYIQLDQGSPWFPGFPADESSHAPRQRGSSLAVPASEVLWWKG